MQIDDTTLYMSLAVGVLMGAWGNYISEKKGRSRLLGFSLGFLFGIIGVIVMYFIPAVEAEDSSDDQQTYEN
ncbi:MAG: hypothetical protein ACON42_07005 [Flavobacteriaceae bacterium]